jgi:aminopeptidase-like protein
MKNNVKAGFNISCIGDDRCYSFMPSRDGQTLSDRVGEHIVQAIDPAFKKYSWLHRGSDERQYCAPGIDLPIASIMRSKYGEYPEYHTSLDDLSFISPAGLEGGLHALIKSIEAIERNVFPKASILGEPQLGKRGLYHHIAKKKSTDTVRIIRDFLTYSDGQHDLIDIANLINVPIWELYEVMDDLREHHLVETKREKYE